MVSPKLHFYVITAVTPTPQATCV